MLQDPIKKDNKLISIYKNPPNKILVDIKIKSVNKLSNNTGYYFNIYISPSNNCDIINELIQFDKEIMESIQENSLKWFDKEFDINEINELYNKSFCNQTKTISVILSNKQIKHILYNNKKIEVDEIVNLLNSNLSKKCLINITIEYYGLYIYSETTSNKWIIKTLDITNIDDEESIVSVDELIDNYIERINNIKTRSKKKLTSLNNDIESINKNVIDIDNIMELLKEKNNISKTTINNNLIKLNELILKQEVVLKNSN
jgi:hypothetical protein